VKATLKVGKFSGINLVNETGEFMVISQFGQIIHIDTKFVRSADGSTKGVKLLSSNPQRMSRSTW
jgi:hypothetical protein